ncbi:MFS transporter [Rhizorhabdus histidinilytica]|uniref:Sugar phosphate permease n=1 Tax=Rhizorhabdus histidinilytica TaxID=439228 RepID=A0A1T5F2I2_9SPHN|nr:MFS transporter [Rhizorhabdus histidinilytica]SKB90402.1 Sugar phosphate permease [Rhizorhabdus histidinilytica]
MSAAPAPAQAHDDWPDNYRAPAAWWAVAVTMIFQIVSMIDRQVVSVLIPEMRADLGLNDFQISMVQGMAFALFYGAMGLIIGALVDRHSRQKIMFTGIVLWSIAAAATGFARNYVQLFVARLFVGFGEGAISPAAQSLLSGIFPRGKLATPMSCFTAAGVIGISLSYALGGLLLDRFTVAPLGGVLEGMAPWRQVLVVTGAPGVAVALLAFTLREPKRAGTPPPQRHEASWGSFFGYIRANARLMLGVILGSALVAMMTQAAMSWTPTYARRVLGVSAGEVGTIMSLAVGLGGVIGGIALGLVIDHWFRRGVHDIALRLLAIAALTVPPLIALCFLADDATILFGGITLMMLTMGAIFGPTLAAVQMIAPPAMRGRFGALVVLASNLFGFAFGPMLVGAITDYGFGDPNKIGVSVAIVLVLVCPFAAWLIWNARGDFVRRLAAVPAHSPSNEVCS